MKLNFPLKTQDLSKWQSASDHYRVSNSKVGGWFPVGRNGFWHGGTHLDGNHPVHAVADGEIIAYRVSEDYIDPKSLSTYPVGDNKIPIVEYPISDNFVLTRHSFTPPKSKPIVFYVLYMNLLPFNPLKQKTGKKQKAQPVFFQSRFFVQSNALTKKEGLKIRDNGLSSVIASIPAGSEVFFEVPHEVAQNHQLKQEAIQARDKYITGYEYKDEYHRQSGYIPIDSSSIEVQKRIDYELDKVITKPFPLRGGDVLGFSGGDGALKDETTVHMEIFIKDEGSYTALKEYTSQQQEKLGLQEEELLNLENYITGKSILSSVEIGNNTTDKYCNIVNLLNLAYYGAKNGKLRIENIMLKPDSHQSTINRLRRLVVKNRSEWQTVEGEFDRLKKENGGTHDVDKQKAYLELYQDKLDFWHLLNDSTTPDLEVGGVPFPDEVYFFHPIKFIDHLRKISQEYLESDLVKELISDWFTSTPKEECLQKLMTIFGSDIKKGGFSRIRKEIINRTFEYPRILIIDKSDPRRNKLFSHTAGYNHATKKTWVTKEFVEAAKKDNLAACGLLIALLEETGHHINNLLRTEYSKQGGEAPLDEGAVFAANVIKVEDFLQSKKILLAKETTNNSKIMVDFFAMKLATSTWLNEFHIKQDDKAGDLSFFAWVPVLGGFANAGVDAALQILTLYLDKKHPLDDFFWYIDRLNKAQLVISFLAGFASGGLGAVTSIIAKSKKIKILLAAITETYMSVAENTAKSLVNDNSWEKTSMGIGFDLLARIAGSKASSEAGKILLNNMTKGLFNGGTIIGEDYLEKDFDKIEKDLRYYKKKESDKWIFIDYNFYFVEKVDNKYVASHWLVYRMQPDARRYSYFYTPYEKSSIEDIKKAYTYKVNKLRQGESVYRTEEYYKLYDSGEKYYVMETCTKIADLDFKDRMTAYRSLKDHENYSNRISKYIFID